MASEAAAFHHTAAPVPWRGLLRAAIWDAGSNSLISHEAAAQVYRWPGFDENRVEVLVPKSLDHVCTIAKVRESRRFELVHQRLMWGIPVVSPADTLVHVAPLLRLKRLQWLTDELLLGKEGRHPHAQHRFLQTWHPVATVLEPACRSQRSRTWRAGS